jgi:hypothetical protein
MNGLSFRSLVGMTVLVSACALWVWSGSGETASPDAKGQPLYPDFSAFLNDIEKVDISSGGETVTLVRRGGEWFLDEWGGYPAKFETVKQVVYGVSQLAIDAPKTARPERWADLGVDDPGIGAAGVGLQLSTGDERLIDLVVGRSGGNNGLYVRRVGEDQSWLVTGGFELPSDGAGFVDTQILQIAADRVGRVQIEHPDGERYSVRRTGEGYSDWELDELALDMELRSAGLLSALGGALARFDLDRVASPGDIDEAAVDWTHARFELTDGLAVTVSTARVEDTDYARIEVEQIPLPPGLDGPPVPGEETAPETPARSDEQIATEVTELDTRVGPWTYVLASWRADALRKRLDELVQPIEPGEAVESVDFDLSDFEVPSEPLDAGEDLSDG